MARYFGKIGYGADVETAPDVWEPSIIERPYFGDVLQFSRRWDSGEGVNDDMRIRHRISIIADPFAYQHAYLIRYVEWLGTKWKVTDIEVEYPRMILTLGGVYNANETTAAGSPAADDWSDEHVLPTSE